jgi:hypothetical protein
MAVHHLGSVDPGSVRWAGDILDRLVAPECSSVSECNAPEIPELPNYFGSFFLNNVFQFNFPDPARPMIVIFLRRLAQSVREYRAGRERLSEYVSALPKTNNVASVYLKSLAHFEQAVGSAYVALLSHNTVAKLIEPKVGRHFEPNDGSPAQRLNSLSNASKHYEKQLLRGETGDHVAPVWIVNSGLKGINNGQIVHLLFDELVGLLGELEANAKYISEDVYRLAIERAANQEVVTKGEP